jgi:cytoskeletal protein CcmA (bactofilin family)
LHNYYLPILSLYGRNLNATNENCFKVNAANEHHARAMELADQADALRLRGQETRSIQVYQQALTEAEEAVWLSSRDGVGVRTLSVLYRSAASLAMECHEWAKARNLIQQGIEILPTGSLEDELKGLLKRLPLLAEASLVDFETAGSDGGNALQSDVEIKGALRADNDLIFNGTLEGEIVSGGELTVGTSADINGEVRARSLNLFGKIRGKTFVKETCKIFPSAVLMGDLKASHLVLQKGGSFIGKSQVGPMGLSADAIRKRRRSPKKMRNSAFSL